MLINSCWDGIFTWNGAISWTRKRYLIRHTQLNKQIVIVISQQAPLINMPNQEQSSPVTCYNAVVWDWNADLCERWVGVQLCGRGTPGPVWPPGRALLWATAEAGCAAGLGSGPGAFPPRGEPWGSKGLCSVLLGQGHRVLGICHGNLQSKWEKDWRSLIWFDWFCW